MAFLLKESLITIKVEHHINFGIKQTPFASDKNHDEHDGPGKSTHFSKPVNYGVKFPVVVDTVHIKPKVHLGNRFILCFCAVDVLIEEPYIIKIEILMIQGQ